MTNMRKKIFIMCLAFFAMADFIGAQGWSSLNSGTNEYLYYANFVSADSGYVYAENGYVYKTVNGGTNWTSIGIPDHFLAGFVSMYKYYGVSGNDLYYTDDGGLNWDHKYTFSNTGISPGTIFLANNGNKIMLASNNVSYDTVYFYKAVNDSNWILLSKIYDTDFMYVDFEMVDSLNWYFMSGLNVYKTIDGGYNWAPTNFIAYSENTSMSVPAKDTLWVVDQDGNVFNTTDGGSNWNQQTVSVSSNPLYSVVFLDTKKGFAVGGDGFSSGTIIQTTDGGLNWQLASPQTETFSTICFPEDATGYAVGSNGIILKYSPASAISGSAPAGFSCNVYQTSTDGDLQITSEIPVDETCIFKIYDLTGNIVIDISIQGGKNSFNLPGNYFSSGMYIYQAISGKRQIAQDKIAIIK